MFSSEFEPRLQRSLWYFGGLTYGVAIGWYETGPWPEKQPRNGIPSRKYRHRSEVMRRRERGAPAGKSPAYSIPICSLLNLDRALSAGDGVLDD